MRNDNEPYFDSLTVFLDTVEDGNAKFQDQILTILETKSDAHEQRLLGHLTQLLFQRDPTLFPEILNSALEYVASNSIRYTNSGLDYLIERVFIAPFTPVAAELSDEGKNSIFEQLKSIADTNNEYFPFQLFGLFGDNGKNYLLERCVEPESSISACSDPGDELFLLFYEKSKLLDGLRNFKDERILQIALDSVLNKSLGYDCCIGYNIDILINHIDDARAQTGLVELFIGFLDQIVSDHPVSDHPFYYSNECAYKCLEALASVDLPPDLKRRILDTKNEFFIGLSKYAEVCQDGGYDFVFEVSIMIKPTDHFALVCGDGLKPTLLERAKNKKAQIRAPAYHALGVLGEADILLTAHTKEKRSKWVKFAISSGLIATGRDDAVAEGMNYLQGLLPSCSEKSRYHISNIIQSDIKLGGETACLHALQANHQELIELGTSTMMRFIADATDTSALGVMKSKLDSIMPVEQTEDMPRARAGAITKLFIAIDINLNKLNPISDLILDLGKMPKLPKCPKASGHSRLVRRN